MIKKRFIGLLLSAVMAVSSCGIVMADAESATLTSSSTKGTYKNYNGTSYVYQVFNGVGYYLDVYETTVPDTSGDAVYDRTTVVVADIVRVEKLSDSVDTCLIPYGFANVYYKPSSKEILASSVGLKAIDSDAFNGTSFEHIRILENDTGLSITLQSNAFRGVSGLKDILIPQTVGAMGMVVPDQENITIFTEQGSAADNVKFYPEGMEIGYLGPILSTGTAKKIIYIDMVDEDNYGYIYYALGTTDFPYYPEEGTIISADPQITKFAIPTTVGDVSIVGTLNTAFKNCVSLKRVNCTKGSFADNESLYPVGTLMVYSDGSSKTVTASTTETTTESTTETTTETTTESTTESTTENTTEIQETVTVKDDNGNTYLLGDLNGDSKVSRVDLVTLAKFFAGVDVDIISYAADINQNGNVDRIDLSKFAKIFAGADTF